MHVHSYSNQLLCVCGYMMCDPVNNPQGIESRHKSKCKCNSTLSSKVKLCDVNFHYVKGKA